MDDYCRFSRNVLANQVLNREIQPGVTAPAWLLSHVPPGGVRNRGT